MVVNDYSTYKNIECVTSCINYPTGNTLGYYKDSTCSLGLCCGQAGC